MFAAISVQHLLCSGMAVTWPSSLQICLVTGQKFCQLRSYAVSFWHEHYLNLDSSKTPAVNYLLHETMVSSLPKGGHPRLQCRRHCNHVLMTGLRMTAVHNLATIGRTYLEMGAEFHACSHSTQTPLHAAVAASSIEMIGLLLEHGADINAFAQDQAEDPHCGHTSDAIVPPDYLFNSCFEHKNCHCWRCCGCAGGMTPLHIAAANGREDVLQLLLAADANASMHEKKHGNTALHLAVKSDNVCAVRCLIDFGADLQAKNAAGETALQFAVMGRHFSIAKILASKNFGCGS